MKKKRWEGRGGQSLYNTRDDSRQRKSETVERRTVVVYYVLEKLCSGCRANYEREREREMKTNEHSAMQCSLCGVSVLSEQGPSAMLCTLLAFFHLLMQG